MTTDTLKTPLRVQMKDRYGNPRPTDMMAFQNSNLSEVLQDAGDWLEDNPHEVIYVQLHKATDGVWSIAFGMKPNGR